MRRVVFATCMLAAILISVGGKSGMTKQAEIEDYVLENYNLITAAVAEAAPGRVTAFSGDISIVKFLDEETGIAFICGTSGIGPDGTYYGFYYSFLGNECTMHACNEYRTEHIKGNIYFFEYTVY